MKVYRIVREDKEFVCSFCHKRLLGRTKMVSDPTKKIFICDECIKACHKLVSEEPQPAK